MVVRGTLLSLLLTLLVSSVVSAQQTGSVRGVVTDKDLDNSPLVGAEITLTGAGHSAKARTSDQGTYVLRQIPPGQYSMVIAKEGYVRQVKSGGVRVVGGSVVEVDVALAGDYAELEEFIVQDSLDLAAGSEAALLQLRLESPSLLDSIGSDLISRAGASDAAGALKIVAGATVKDGKSAVIRGLPDRYVSSQLNGVRLPTADEDKRAVELDQFPSAVIEQLLVSKTFTPDQQGDASGGAVNVLLKGLPKEALFFQFKGQTGFNTQVNGSKFLSYKGGGLSFFGKDKGSRDPQLDLLGSDWLGAVGVSEGSAPIDYKWSLAGGASHEFESGIRVGGFLNVFYEKDSSFSDNGVDDSYWIETPGGSLTPRASQGSVQEGDFKTSLFDVTRASRSVQLGTLATFGIEAENHALRLTYLFTRTTEDKATLAEDTRGKSYFFPGYDPEDPTTPGHSDPDSAPYTRLETLEYTERSVSTLQLNGTHTLETKSFGFKDVLNFESPEIDWTAALSTASLNQPDKRQFGSLWFPEREIFGFVIPASHRQFKPAANFNLGNLQRIYKEIDETSHQAFLNLKLPFEQWSGDKGYFKFGYFYDQVDRVFEQETFSNFGDNSSFEGPFEQFWSSAFPSENHPISESNFDVDYDGNLKVTAWYAMLRVPVFSALTLTGGVRFESTEIGIINTPEADATWFPPGATAPVTLNPGDADVAYKQDDVLPSLAFEYKTPLEGLTLRGSYNQTVARQTFKELTPILQQEFLGGPIFIGNPELTMSSVKNYDLRVDYRPNEGSLFSASWFRKDIKDPIETVQRVGLFDYTSPVNYPDGKLTGFEFEIRQDLGALWEPLEGLSIGANATFIDAKVRLPDDEIAAFNQPNILAPMRERDMTNAPEYLYNLYLTYDLAATGTQFSVFYTVQGDTLIAGAGESAGNFVPSLYATEFDSLNASVSQRIGDHIKVQVQAKNLTNPSIETVYRSPFGEGDVIRSSFSQGIDLSISVSGEFRF